MNFDDQLATLISRHRNGDQEALPELLALLGPRIRLAARARLGSVPYRDEAADDVGQEVLLAISTNFESFEIDIPQQLLYLTSRITSNKCIDHIRSEKRQCGPRSQPIQPLTADDTSGHFPFISLVIDDGATPSSLAARNETFEALMLELDRLSTQHREAVVLSCFEGLSTHEIGRRLSISRHAAANLIARALTRIRSNYRKRLVPEPANR